MEIESDERDRQREMEEIEEIRKRIVDQTEEMEEQVCSDQHENDIRAKSLSPLFKSLQSWFDLGSRLYYTLWQAGEEVIHPWKICGDSSFMPQDPLNDGWTIKSLSSLC